MFVQHKTQCNSLTHSSTCACMVFMNAELEPQRDDTTNVLRTLSSTKRRGKKWMLECLQKPRDSNAHERLERS